jgi:hypothetical protein
MLNANHPTTNNITVAAKKKPIPIYTTHKIKGQQANIKKFKMKNNG